MTLTYTHTRRACYFGYITQAILNNLAPLLFVLFQSDFGLSYEKLGSLIFLNFMTQMATDLAAMRFADRMGYRGPLVAAHVCSALGLVLLGVLPFVLPSAYAGLAIAVVVYAFGGGLLEVLVSPLVDALPAPPETKAATMSLLHSFYCWGQVGVVAVSTLLLQGMGATQWRVLPFLWALVPFCNLFVLLRVPMPKTRSAQERTSVRTLLQKPAFLAVLLLMLCAGASELTISQWSSLFAEQGLGVSKMLGDLAGPCMFGVLMGLGRTFYGMWGARIRLVRYMALCGGLCVVCYLVVALSASPVISLVACAVSGFAVACMWPGSCSLASARFPTGGTAMFAALAVFGDIGCSVGPWMAGLVAGRVESGSGALARLGTLLSAGSAAGLKTGILVGSLFPVLLVVTLWALREKQKNGRI